jgi:1,4-alpha-glucan branching enzyme
MGGEIGQWDEWYHESSVHWHLLEYPEHEGIRRWTSDLNRYYRSQPALYQRDFTFDGFEWIDCNDYAASVLSFMRKDGQGRARVVAVANFTPVPRLDYRIGVPYPGRWKEVLNSDAADYGGSGIGNLGGVDSRPEPAHGQPQSVLLALPPLGIVVLEHDGE